MKNIKKGKADGEIYDIINFDQYKEINKDLYGPIAIEMNGIIYPERTQGDGKPGLYKTDWGAYLIDPNENEKDLYSSDNIIDFDSTDMKELIEKSNKLKDMEREILTTIDNVFKPPLLENDEPEVRALKEAVIAKKIDIRKYSSRFGNDFQNDRRLLSKSRISMDKLKIIMRNLDLKATLTIEDKHPNVPNPMNKKITIDLIGDNE